MYTSVAPRETEGLGVDGNGYWVESIFWEWSVGGWLGPMYPLLRLMDPTHGAILF